MFWCNYFSHVKPITAKGAFAWPLRLLCRSRAQGCCCCCGCVAAAVVDDPAAAAAAAVAGAAASPHSDRAVAATPTKPGPAAGAAGAASAGGMNGAQRLVASTAAGAGAAAPGAGATRLTAQTAALGGAGAAAIAGGAGSGSVTGVKQGQEVKERKASLPVGFARCLPVIAHQLCRGQEVPWALDEKCVSMCSVCTARALTVESLLPCIAISQEAWRSDPLGHHWLWGRDGRQERPCLPEVQRQPAGRGHAADAQPGACVPAMSLTSAIHRLILRPRTTRTVTACPGTTRRPLRSFATPRSTPSTSQRHRGHTSNTPSRSVLVRWSVFRRC